MVRVIPRNGPDGRYSCLLRSLSLKPRPLVWQFGWRGRGLLASGDISTWTLVWEFMARNWALTSIVPTVAVLILFPWYIVRKYTRIALNQIEDFFPPRWPETRDFAPIEGKSVTFDAFDGHQLRGTMFPADPRAGRKGTIIFAHEFGMDRWSYYPYGKPLREAGYDVFAFDFRGHGESPGEKGYKPRQLPSDRELADMLGAIAHVGDWLERRGRPRTVGILGLSRGAAAAVMAAVDVANVGAIAVDGLYSSDASVEYHLKHWASIFAKVRLAYENHPPIVWRFLRWVILHKAKEKFGCSFPSVRKAMKRLTGVPMLFIHGERDTYIPIAQGRALYEIANGPKQFWSVPGARHNRSMSMQPEEYARRLVVFFDEHLAGVDQRLTPATTSPAEVITPVEKSTTTQHA